MATVALSGIITPSNVVTATSTTTLTNKTLTGAVVNGTVGATTPAAGAFTGVNTPNTFGFKNRIINGDMRIDQRNAGASVTQTVSAVYTLDRWQMYGDVTSKFSVQQNAGSVTPPTGFTNYLGVTSLSAYTLATDDRFFVRHKIEGFNTADLDFGKATAKAITVSFWVRSSLTGTFGGSIQNGAGDRSYPFTFTINSANTWEYETITIAGDTSGTWLTTNGIGLVVNFGLGVQGSTYAGTAGAWNSNNNYSATGGTSVVSTNGATFYITGVQFETGSTATSFDVRDYGCELIMCQRYAYVWNSAFGENNYRLLGLGFAKTTTRVDIQTYYPVVMRTNPSTTFSAANTLVVEDGPNSLVPSSVSTSGQEINMCNINFTVSGGTQFRPYSAGANNTLTAKIIWSAEL